MDKFEKMPFEATEDGAFGVRQARRSYSQSFFGHKVRPVDSPTNKHGAGSSDNSGRNTAKRKA